MISCQRFNTIRTSVCLTGFSNVIVQRQLPRYCVLSLFNFVIKWYKSWINEKLLNIFRLKPLDVEFMKALHNKVNIVPVLSKADTLTISEVKRLKQRILEEIASHDIQIYNLPDADDDEEEDFKEQTRSLKV